MESWTKSKINYHFYKSHGICTYCNKEKAIKGETRCLACKMDTRERGKARYQCKKTTISEQDKKAKLEQAKRLRAHYKANGLCTVCGKPTYKNRTRCLECLTKNKKCAERIRKRKQLSKPAGSCFFCDKPVVDGYKVCAECLQRNREYLAHARSLVNHEKHPWRQDDNIVFARKE